MMLQSAVLGDRRLSGDQAAGHRRHHHRQLDPDLARAGAGRARDRQLAGLRRRAPELAAPATSCCRELPAERRAAWRCPAQGQRCRVEGVSVVPPGVQKIVVQDVAFTLKAGQGLGIIGPSASGKSSLARAIVGVWPAAARQGPPRRRRARPVVAGDARPAHRLPAAGRRAVRRHGRAEHRPLRPTRRPEQVIAAARRPACTS